MVRPADGAQNRREKRGATRDAASRRAPRARGREATEALLRDTASDGLSLHVEVDGPDDGPVAVLVHGFAGSVELAWRATGVSTG